MSDTDSILSGVLDSIKKYDQNLKPEVTSHGKSKEGIERYSLNLSNGIFFNVGENLNFSINQVVVRTLKSLHLQNKKAVDDFIRECLSKKSFFLGKISNADFGEIWELAKKHIPGKWLEFARNEEETEIRIKYPQFEVRVTSLQVMVIGNRSKQAVMALSRDKNSLKEIFSTIKYFAESFEKGEFE